jgi:hypothetical protein
MSPLPARPQRIRTLHHSLRDPNNANLREMPNSLLVAASRAGAPVAPEDIAPDQATGINENGAKRIRSPSIELIVPVPPLKKAKDKSTNPKAGSKKVGEFTVF